MNFRACILFSCRDRPKIVAEISEFLARKNLNIFALEQHSENNFFFTRVEFEISENFDEKKFAAENLKIEKKFAGKFSLHFFSKTQKCGFFLSREPHAILKIFSKIETGEWKNLEIKFVKNFLTKKKKFAKIFFFENIFKFNFKK